LEKYIDQEAPESAYTLGNSFDGRLKNLYSRQFTFGPTPDEMYNKKNSNNYVDVDLDSYKLRTTTTNSISTQLIASQAQAASLKCDVVGDIELVEVDLDSSKINAADLNPKRVRKPLVKA